MLHDINATDKDLAAGGRNSVKNQYGVSDPYAAGVRKEEGGRAVALRARIDRLQAISLRVHHYLPPNQPPTTPLSRPPCHCRNHDFAR